jgi:hypothetical protein
MQGSKLVLALVAVVAITGCGLPDQYYLRPPNPGNQPLGSGNFFTFSNPDHTKDLNINFKGYELYYQFYAPTQTVNNNVYDPNNPASVDAQLRAAGFLPVTSGGTAADGSLADSYPNRTDPVIPVSFGDIGTPFSITVQVITSTSPTVQPAAQYIFSGALGLGFLLRDVSDSSVYIGKYKGFQSNSLLGPSSNNYILGDADCTNIGSNIVSSSAFSPYVYLAMYAVSYGLIGVSTPQRSSPTYLGYLTIN